MCELKRVFAGVLHVQFYSLMWIHKNTFNISKWADIISCGYRSEFPEKDHYIVN